MMWQQAAYSSLRKKEIAAWYIIMPSSTFKTFWNMVLIVLLVYVATVVPY